METKFESSKKEFDKWYNEQFLPFKKGKDEQKKAYTELAVIVKNNPQEVKYMIANILDAKFDKAVQTWNLLKLEPKLTQMKLESNQLIISNQDMNKQIDLDMLLDMIEKVLKEF